MSPIGRRVNVALPAPMKVILGEVVREVVFMSMNSRLPLRTKVASRSLPCTPLPDGGDIG